MIFTITVLVCVQNRFRYSYTSTFLPYNILKIQIFKVDDSKIDVAIVWLGNRGGMTVRGCWDVLSSKFISNKFEKYFQSVLGGGVRWSVDPHRVLGRGESCCLYHSIHSESGRRPQAGAGVQTCVFLSGGDRQNKLPHFVFNCSCLASFVRSCVRSFVHCLLFVM